ncbi:MAG: acetylxylan esterase [Planctomycetaceae bacterium]|nr:acetylxylan esterase [Planctomycetaceae bacterium]
MRLLLISFGVLAVTTAALPADFPPLDKLPASADMPSPVVMLDGTKVTTKADWEAKRRPQLKELFQHYMYGKYPAKPEKVTGKVLFEDAKAFGGKGTLREVEITFGPPEWPKIYLLIATPNGKTPAACFVGPNFQGNHCLVADERVRITPEWCYPNTPGVKANKASAEGRGKVLDVWPFEQALDKGYAVATFYSGDIQPDRPNVIEGMRKALGFTEGKNNPDDTATVMSWAWGVHRAVDYLVTDPSVDPKRIAVVGHSRLGKTALLAGAFDDRIALVIPHQSGCGGAGPSRLKTDKAESVARITKAFPHWFCGNFTAFGPDTSKLPFDQNDLVAICAPRPVLMTNAEEDLWANPSGQFEVLKAAAPAYELYELAKPVVADKMPESGKLASERLGYFIRAGKHSMTPDDWKVYMEFADKWLK